MDLWCRAEPKQHHQLLTQWRAAMENNLHLLSFPSNHGGAVWPCMIIAHFTPGLTHHLTGKNGWAARLHVFFFYSCHSALLSLYFLLQNCQRYFGPWLCTTGSAPAAGQALSSSSSSSQRLQCWRLPSCLSWRGSQPFCTPCVCTGKWCGPLELCLRQTLRGIRLWKQVASPAGVRMLC